MDWNLLLPRKIIGSCFYSHLFNGALMKPKFKALGLILNCTFEKYSVCFLCSTYNSIALLIYLIETSLM